MEHALWDIIPPYPVILQHGQWTSPNSIQYFKKQIIRKIDGGSSSQVPVHGPVYNQETR